MPCLHLREASKKTNEKSRFWTHTHTPPPLVWKIFCSPSATFHLLLLLCNDFHLRALGGETEKVWKLSTLLICNILYKNTKYDLSFHEPQLVRTPHGDAQTN